jgi:geranylgeranyl diphosphate synthase, type II
VDIARYLAARARLVEGELARRFAPVRPRLRQAIRYSLLAGGKRIRPILAIAAGEVAGARPRLVLPFACALEMIHTYSLVHDDLPAMDDDEVRRGRPTSHRVFGEGLAILVGDALLTEAFHVMATARGVPAERVVRVMAEIAGAAGEGGMVGGQALDLAASGRATSLARVREIHRAKTGALLRVALRAGALVASVEPSVLRCLTRYGEHLGLSFQIADDILDAVGGPEGDGRTDRALGKATYPAVLGVDGARREALAERDAAIASLRSLGRAAEPLRAIAEYVIGRVGLMRAADAPPVAAAPPVLVGRVRRAQLLH